MEAFDTRYEFRGILDLVHGRETGPIQPSVTIQALSVDGWYSMLDRLSSVRCEFRVFDARSFPPSPVSEICRFAGVPVLRPLDLEGSYSADGYCSYGVVIRSVEGEVTPLHPYVGQTVTFRIYPTEKEWIPLVNKKEFDLARSLGVEIQTRVEGTPVMIGSRSQYEGSGWIRYDSSVYNDEKGRFYRARVSEEKADDPHQPLEKCPFCENVTPFLDTSCNEVCCSACGARGGPKATLQEAIYDWNRWTQNC